MEHFQDTQSSFFLHWTGEMNTGMSEIEQEISTITISGNCDPSQFPEIVIFLVQFPKLKCFCV